MTTDTGEIYCKRGEVELSGRQNTEHLKPIEASKSKDEICVYKIVPHYIVNLLGF